MREGIDDYRYLLTLKKLAQAAAASYDAGTRVVGEAGLKLLEEISERTNPAHSRSGRYGRSWQLLGDMDAERSRVIDAILRIRDSLQFRPIDGEE